MFTAVLYCCLYILQQETIRLVEEFNEGTGTNDCYYLFEMQSSVTCQKAALVRKDKDKLLDIRIEIV